MLNIPVVLGSVREDRKSIHAANFLVEKLKALGVETSLVDFKEMPLPFLIHQNYLLSLKVSTLTRTCKSGAVLSTRQMLL
jgi:NAD(P)H-dependent FMN reductase